MTRNVEEVVTAHRQLEGGGFVVRRPFPTGGLDLVDPFLLLDEMGPADYAPGEAVGAPDHPHRGFETVTYMGEALGVRAVIDTHTPIVYQDWTLFPGAVVEQPIPEGHNALVYVFEGGAAVGRAETPLADGQLGRLGAGGSVRLAVPANAPAGARLLLLAGQPLGEPVARYGPFVMNTEAEIRRAFLDFRSGSLGEIRARLTD